MARRLAVPGGEKPEDLHVTLAYLGPGPWRAEQLESMRRVVAQVAAERTGPLAATISGVGLFTEGERPVTYLSIDSPDLPALREGLVRRLALRGEPGARHVVTLRNSWGPGWGQHGDGYVAVEDLERLLGMQGEACVPRGRRRPKEADGAG